MSEFKHGATCEHCRHEKVEYWERVTWVGLKPPQQDFKVAKDQFKVRVPVMRYSTKAATYREAVQSLPHEMMVASLVWEFDGMLGYRHAQYQFVGVEVPT